MPLGDTSITPSPEGIFGPISLQGLQQDYYRRIPTGKLPEAEIAYLDETFKAWPITATKSLRPRETTILQPIDPSLPAFRRRCRSGKLRARSRDKCIGRPEWIPHPSADTRERPSFQAGGPERRRRTPEPIQDASGASQQPLWACSAQERRGAPEISYRYYRFCNTPSNGTSEPFFTLTADPCVPLLAGVHDRKGGTTVRTRKSNGP